DLLREPIDVCPTAHFHMGGVRIRPDCSTAIAGLYVAGEDSGGVHGANRLGGNGVADSTVFGARAGDAIATATGHEATISDHQLAEAVKSATEFLGRESRENVFALTRALYDLMWEHVGVVRDAGGLATALAGIGDLAERLGRVGAPRDPAVNPVW